MDNQAPQKIEASVMRSGRSIVLLIMVAVLVGIGALFLANYAAPFVGGKRDMRSLAAGLGLYVGVGVLLLSLYSRPATRKVARLCVFSTVIALIYVGYIMSGGVKLPDSANLALEHFMADQGISEFSISYVWQGPIQGHPHYVTPYCVIVDPALADGRNAFILDQSVGGYRVEEGSPTESTWKELGCGHVDDVSNSTFDP